MNAISDLAPRIFELTRWVCELLNTVFAWPRSVRMRLPTTTRPWGAADRVPHGRLVADQPVKRPKSAARAHPLVLSPPPTPSRNRQPPAFANPSCTCYEVRYNLWLIGRESRHAPRFVSIGAGFHSRSGVRALDWRRWSSPAALVSRAGHRL